MALAPRSLVRLMSHSKPYLISFSSSSSSDDAILLAAPGTATPVARAVQPPTAPGSSCGRSVTQEQKVLHPLPSSTPKIPIHKPSRPTLCNTLKPLKDTPLPAKQGDHKVPRSPKFRHFPSQSIPEPVGKSLTATLEDPKHSVPGDSCSTLRPVTHKYSPKAHPNHKVCEDRRVPKDGSFREPPHPTPDPFVNEHAYKSSPKAHHDHKVCEDPDIQVRPIPKDVSFREPPHPTPDPLVNEHESSPKPHPDHKVCENPDIRVLPISTSRRTQLQTLSSKTMTKFEHTIDESWRGIGSCSGTTYEQRLAAVSQDKNLGGYCHVTATMTMYTLNVVIWSDIL